MLFCVVLSIPLYSLVPSTQRNINSSILGTHPGISNVPVTSLHCPNWLLSIPRWADWIQPPLHISPQKQEVNHEWGKQSTALMPGTHSWEFGPYVQLPVGQKPVSRSASAKLAGWRSSNQLTSWCVLAVRGVPIRTQ